MKCLYHNDREAEYVCTICGQPVCRECATTLNGKNVCKACAYKANQYDIPQYNHIPYKRGDGVNGFFFFVFLIIPGLRHMYLGLMKRGFEFLVAFFGSFTVAMLLGNSIEDIFIPVLFIVWFYSAFDSHHSRKLIAKGEKVEDSPVFNEYSLERLKDYIGQRKHLVGVGIVLIGIFALLKNIRSYSWKFQLPQAVVTIIDIAFGSIVPVLLIVGGLYLLSKYRKKDIQAVETVENE